MKRWNFFPQEAETSYILSKELNVSPILAQILINRKITDSQNAMEFLSPTLMNLKDPFDIPNIKKGVERVVLAKTRGEKVVVYGDYDVDGVTGTAILIETLKHIGITPSYYIPHRYEEGYSLNINAIKKLKDEKANLIITVDCGISSITEVKEANAIGIEIIITDHHNVPQQIPNAYAVINPKMIEKNHPSRDLSGAGVAFKFAWALLRIMGETKSDFLTQLLDLAALGTIADVVPLTNENRIIAKKGLSILRERKRIGTKILADVSGLKPEISIRDVNFGLAPRLNAAGRLKHASLAVNLLISKTIAEAETLAKELNKANLKRQGIGDLMNNEILQKIKNNNLESEKIIVVSGESWHPGVIGITASKIVDKYYRPVILISVNQGTGRGSARSIDNFNIFKLLESCKELFVDFGGHEAAAGFVILPENIPILKDKIYKEVFNLKIEYDPKINIETTILPEQITLSLIEELKLLGPHGQANPIPVFSSHNLKIREGKVVGSNENHLKLKLSNGKTNLEAIGFGFGKMKETIDFNLSHDFAYLLESNEWNGIESAQLNLVDVKHSNQTSYSTVTDLARFLG
ncbi:single-stranded-DNA-specific exonuclease RecJ [candidate division WOR-1 bacterium RIFOXYD2_FULL_36_8]|uniref:Single-stranded-DNA-specific exonuclease RecJ n=1 Tax=candidate division WOR-1 bacterium RIFOXYB2_FULL_36_35 TaxID=1802578 RepID=A0A1F4S526_UNCSA|nr:MAG: single-stranded-DNA-specific exonuclease RecJ [candidate division WOR-1 bacterium RIFOXYA2_FULL_36_21]OGC14520.1 MAG: single-stranded-DNA-specific exonuclease RecJ [candidate division WOR-1 bacterium RIFOXYA12_FULL_36_13]OGC15499.1 MAG: single-stranded-DNA-specific exonuclease RecJ [candidate division WOR-1 bacterium RIFOXYB2_FULL_36_35]OGC41226.1 MAG: single-stranded-DNA-specific exonuclease RecJ [candidate division WOR-1 bacterium RIFOXYD2_FULL_36_8]